MAAWFAMSCLIAGRWWGSMTEGYVELHSASAFSFLEGASQPEGLIKRAVELQMPAMALLDRNGVYGAARFHTSAKRNGVITGNPHAFSILNGIFDNSADSHFKRSGVPL